MPGLLSGEVEIGQHTMLVQDGELMVYIPDGEGGSEPIDWNTCSRLLVLLQLCIFVAREQRGT